jgi:hypothetical protein
MFTYLFVVAMVPLSREWYPIMVFAKIPAVSEDFRGLVVTAESDPSVSLKSRAPIPRFQWHRWILFRGLMEHGICYKNVHSGSRWNCGNRSRGLLETTESELCKRLSLISRRNRFSPWIRALGRIVWWKKNRGLKISWHCPFKYAIIFNVLTSSNPELRYDMLSAGRGRVRCCLYTQDEEKNILLPIFKYFFKISLLWWLLFTKMSLKLKGLIMQIKKLFE